MDQAKKSQNVSGKFSLLKNFTLRNSMAAEDDKSYNNEHYLGLDSSSPLNIEELE